jgi:hypothetical protein
MNTPQDDDEQAAALRRWRKRRGCLHWLWIFVLAVYLSLRSIA